LAELVDGNDPVKLTESHQRPWLDVAREFPGVFPMKDFGGFLACEALNHLRQTITRFDNELKEKNVNEFGPRASTLYRCSAASTASGWDSATSA
jgi:hypothetical protein